MCRAVRYFARSKRVFSQASKVGGLRWGGDLQFYLALWLTEISSFCSSLGQGSRCIEFRVLIHLTRRVKRTGLLRCLFGFIVIHGFVVIGEFISGRPLTRIVSALKNPIRA